MLSQCGNCGQYIGATTPCLCPSVGPVESGAHLAALADARAEIERLKAEVQHWKSNHANAVDQKRELLDRPDLGDRAKSIQAKDARISSLEADCALLGAFCYEANGKHGYSAIRFNDALNAILASSTASAWVKGTQ